MPDHKLSSALLYYIYCIEHHARWRGGAAYRQAHSAPVIGRAYYLRAHSASLPWSMSRPCLSEDIIGSRTSSIAFGLPGRFTIRVSFLIPASARQSIARIVICRLMFRIASGMPGVRRVITESVASGVTSRFEKPVPPVVTIRSIPSLSAICIISAASWSCSSGSITYFATSKLSENFLMIASIVGPPLSSLRPCEPLSLDVMIPTFYISVFYFYFILICFTAFSFAAVSKAYPDPCRYDCNCKWSEKQ